MLLNRLLGNSDEVCGVCCEQSSKVTIQSIRTHTRIYTTNKHKLSAITKAPRKTQFVTYLSLGSYL